MKRILKLTKKVNIPLEIAYQVVQEAEHYLPFLPTVKAVQIIAKNHDSVIADLQLRHRLLTIYLQCEAILNPGQSILVRQIKGPLKNY